MERFSAAAPIIAASLTLPASASAQPLIPERAAQEVCADLMGRENYPREVWTVGGDRDYTFYLIQGSTDDGKTSIECEYEGPSMNQERNPDEEAEVEADAKQIQEIVRKEGVAFLRKFLRDLEMKVFLENALIADIPDDKKMVQAAIDRFRTSASWRVEKRIENEIKAGRRKIKNQYLVNIWLGEETSLGETQYIDAAVQNPSTGDRILGKSTGFSFDGERVEQQGPDGIVDWGRTVIQAACAGGIGSFSIGRSWNKRSYPVGPFEQSVQAYFAGLSKKIREAHRQGRLVSPNDSRFRQHAGHLYRSQTK